MVLYFSCDYLVEFCSSPFIEETALFVNSVLIHFFPVIIFLHL